VHQAASACYDYFKWGDFLTGNGNDYCEGGWLDRNYYGLALGCSTGILNDVPYSYAAHWGMPHEIARRRMYLVNAFGAAAEPLFGLVEGMEHRDVNVLMLYPLDLVAVEERFGSWMTQYGYANYITADKLLERGNVSEGCLQVAGRSFDTLVALFEPFPSNDLLNLMKEFVQQGGKLIWSGPPPLVNRGGKPCLSDWQDLFGVDFVPNPSIGISAPLRQVLFRGSFSTVSPQIIPTDFLVDYIYPVQPRENTEVVATVGSRVVGTLKTLEGSTGVAAFLGYRPRDDQSQSLGYDVRNWFEILVALGAYNSPEGTTAQNTEYLSRLGEIMCCRFPNGALTFAPHLRVYEEGWPGGFARKDDEDAAYLERRPPPPDDLILQDFRVHGRTVSYTGKGSMAFRLNDPGDLVAFAGNHTNKLTVDGRTFVFADASLGQIGWGPVSEDRRVPGGAVLQILVHGTGTIRIPAVDLPERFQIFAEGPTPGSRGAIVRADRDGDSISIQISPDVQGKWLFLVPQS